MKNPISLKIKLKLKNYEKDLHKALDGAGSDVLDSYIDTVSAGGKRLRPALVYICSQFSDIDESSVHQAALAVEIIHAASLVHDDIMDGASIRRGKPTVYSLKGTQVALRTGDYLFAQAFILLNDTGSFRAVNILSDAVKKLTEGEIEQIKSAFNPHQEIDYYLEKIGCKTAELFRACSELGALFGGADDDVIYDLGEYAQNLGVAFQIYDDILDVSADEKKLGKSLGTDLKDGTLTLPILLAIEASRGERLAEIFTNRNSSPNEVKEGLEIIASTNAIEDASKEAMKFVGLAKKNLNGLCDEKLKKELSLICDYTVERYS